MKNFIQFSTVLILNLLTTVTTKAQSIGNIYEFESDANGFNTKTLFYDDGKEVVAFDAQFTVETANKAIDFLRTKTNNPVKYLVVTHPNPDKFNGIPAFQSIGAKVVMSKLSIENMPYVYKYKKYYFVEMAKMFTEETYPKMPAADITFEDNYEIKLANGGVVELTELKQRGISTNQTVAFVTTANALIVGDLVHHNAHAWLEGPIVKGVATFNCENWISVLQQIQSKFNADAEVYGGRGQHDKLSVVIPQQITYLQTAKKITLDYIASIGGDKSKVDYTRLQKEFEQKFPTYSLSYMIAYGAYGIIANSR